MKKFLAMNALVLTFVTLSLAGRASAQVQDIESLVSAEEMAQDLATTDGDGLQANEQAQMDSSYPYPQPYPYYPRVTCYAKNLRGNVFASLGRDPIFTQEEAMTACRIVSARCVPAGCLRN